jgi:hypothetical protein
VSCFELRSLLTRCFRNRVSPALESYDPADAPSNDVPHQESLMREQQDKQRPYQLVLQKEFEQENRNVQLREQEKEYEKELEKKEEIAADAKEAERLQNIRAAAALEPTRGPPTPAALPCSPSDSPPHASSPTPADIPASTPGPALTTDPPALAPTRALTPTPAPNSDLTRASTPIPSPAATSLKLAAVAAAPPIAADAEQRPPSMGCFLPI